MNPVLVARQFQFRVEVFFKEILVDCPLGKIKYYVIRVEFQIRSSPYIHSSLWFLNAPVLSEDTIDHYKEWVDFITSARLPDLTKNPKLFELVKMYRLHRHSKTCRKYKNRSCRFNFGRYFTEKTIIAKPLPSSLKDHKKADIMVERNKILTKVKEYIDKELDSAKVNFYDRTKEDFAKTKSITEILQELETEVEYQNALSISSDDDYELHLQRPPDSYFVNNYFENKF